MFFNVGIGLMGIQKMLEYQIPGDYPRPEH